MGSLKKFKRKWIKNQLSYKKPWLFKVKIVLNNAIHNKKKIIQIGTIK